MVEAVEDRCEILAAPEQNIAGGSHGFVTDFRLRSETIDQESDHNCERKHENDDASTSNR